MSAINKYLLIIFFILAYNNESISQISGIKTIDPNGSGSNNYSSITDAVTELSNFGINGPVVFNIASGTYNEQLTIPYINGSSSTNSVVFQSTTGNKNDVTIQYTGNSTNNFVIYLNRSKHLTLTNLTFKALSPTYSSVIYSYDSVSNINIINNKIESSINTTYSSSHAVYFRGSSYEDSKNITISNNEIIGGYSGLYIYYNTNNVVIQNNDISEFYYYGIYAKINSSVISNNTIKNRSVSGYGVKGIEIYNYDYKNEISNNRINLSGSSNIIGLEISGVYLLATKERNIISNNSIICNNTGTATFKGLYNNGVNNRFIFNSVYLLGSGSNSYAAYFSQINNTECVNNIFATDSNSIVFYSNSQTSNDYIFDYNVLYNQGDVLAKWKYTDSSFSDLQTSSGQFSNSHFVNPDFISDTLLISTNDSLNGTGLHSTGIIKDINNNIRSYKPDIGAYEFSATGKDAAISWYSPITPISSGSKTIKVVITNTKSTTIGSVNLSYFDNNTVVSENFNGLNITANNSDTLSFSTQYDFSSSTNIRAFINSVNGSGDTKHTNDTTNWQNLAPSLNGIYTINSNGVNSGRNYISFTDAVDALINYGISGAVTFKAHTGTYTEYINIPRIVGSSLANTITFTSLSGNMNDVIIQFEDNNIPIINLNNTNYISIKNMTLKALSLHESVIELENNCNNIIIDSNKILAVIGTVQNGVGIKSYKNQDSNCVYSNNIIEGGSIGISLYGSDSYLEPMVNIRTINNTISEFKTKGIYINSVKGNYINNNYVTNKLGVNGPQGIYCNGRGERIITNNTIIMEGTSYSTGLAYYGGYDESDGYAANNVIVCKGGTSGNKGVEIVSGGRFYNNTVYITGGDSNSTACYISYHNYSIYNNIFANTAGGTALKVSDQVNQFVLKNNCLYTSGNLISKFHVYDRFPTVDSLESYYDKAENNISFLPNFTSTTDLHTNSIGLNGKGIRVAKIIKDIDGEIRASYPDIGADEFTATGTDAAIEWGMTFEPISTSNIDISIVLHNTMSSTITTAQIAYSNGSTPNIETISGLSILPGAFDTIVFSTQYDQSFGDSIYAYIIKVNGIVDFESVNNNTEWQIFGLPLSGIYSINKNIPTNGSNYTSFNDAVNGLVNYGIDGPVVFNVDSGIYNESISIPNIMGTDSYNTIVFRSATSNDEVVLQNPSPNSSVFWTIRLDTTNYISIRNMKISIGGDYTGFINVIMDVGSNNIIIDSCIIEGDFNNSNFQNLFKKDGYITSVLKNISITNNEFIGGSYSMVFQPVSASNYEGVNIINNKLSLFTKRAIVISKSDIINIIDNEISGSGQYGIYANDITNANIHNNKIEISGSSGSGIYITGSNYRVYDTHSISIVNNFINSTYSAGSTLYGIYLRDVGSTEVYYNTICINSSYYRAAALYEYNGENHKIVNNIFNCKNSGYTLYNTLATAISEFHHNVMYTASSSFAYYGNNSPNDLIGLESLSYNFANSSSELPVFADTTSLHLGTNFSLKGIPINGITTDIDGDVRNAITPGIGADESAAGGLFIPVDAKVLSIIPEKKCNGYQHINIVLKNISSDTIFKALIKWEINNVEQANYNWNGSIASGDSISIYIDSTWLNGTQTYSFKSYFATVNGLLDINPSNDTAVNNYLIYQKPHIILAVSESVCENENFLDINVTPSGGMFSGDGISGNKFYPDLTSNPANLVYYNYTDTNGCSSSDSLNIFISTKPIVDAGVDQTIIYGDIATLVGSSVGDTSNYNFNWTPSNLVNNPNSISTSTKAILTDASYTFMATDKITGCSETDAVSIVINGYPLSVSLTSDKDTICSADIVNLKALANGGTNTYTYSWTSIPAGYSSTLDSINVSPLVNTTYYLVINDGTDIVYDSIAVNVSQYPLIEFASQNTMFCEDATASLLTVSPSSGTLSGTGISGYNFDPSIAGVGSHSIDYSYTNSIGCTSYDTLIIDVVARPTAVFISPTVTSYCSYNDSVLLQGFPSGGSFSGTGVNGDYFSPFHAQAGSNKLYYNYTDANGCVSLAANIYINVKLQPIVNITTIIDSSYCSDANDINLQATPIGGTFIGNGIIGNTFSLQLVNQVQNLIIYNFIDSSGCSSSDSVLINVNSQPVVNILTALNSSYCSSEFDINLSATPYGGSFNGIGIIDSLWSPSAIVNDNVEIVYSFLDSNNCLNSDTISTIVYSAQNITISPLSSSYCVNDNTVVLAALPVGGTFSGIGITDSLFNPTVAGVGTHTINYSYTDTNGCSSSDSIIALVNSLPIVSFSSMPDVCEDASPISLSVSPLGGTFSGEGVFVQSNFYPQVSGRGLFNLNYIYIDSNGCSNSANSSIKVKGLPNATFNIPSTACVNSAVNVTFTGVVSSLATYIWNFNNANINSGSNAGPYNLDWSTDGLKQLSLTVLDSGCTSTITDNYVNILNSYAMITAVGNTTACYGDSITMFANSSVGNSYQWHDLNGAIVGDTLSYFSATQSGSYFCMVSQENSCAAYSDTIDVIVKSQLVADFTLAQNSCLGDILPISFNGIAPIGSSYNWDFDSGIIASGSNEGPYNIIWNIDSIQTVGLIITDGNCSSELVEKDININSTPALITVLGSSSFCEGESVSLSANVGPYSYEWLKDGITTSNTQSIYTANTAGNYTVKVTNLNNGCINNSDSMEIIVNTTDFNLAFTATPTNFNIPPFNTVMTNQSQNVNDFYWMWNFDDGNTSTFVNPTHQYLYDGTYTVGLIAQNIATGCFDTLVKTDYINCAGGSADPCDLDASIGNIGENQICATDSTKLYAKDHTVGISYQWLVDGIIIGGATDSVYYAKQTGLYQLLLADALCSEFSQPFALSKFNSVMPTILTNGGIVPCTNDSMELYVSTSFNYYQWSNGSNNASIYVNTSGSYIVTITDNNNCQSVSESYVVNASLLEVPDICIVGIDTLSNHNRIVWERENIDMIDSFNIYRESTVAGVYNLIGSQPFSTLSVFEDVNSNPAQQAYRYRITAVDTCGMETAPSPIHKTLHLTINAGLGDVWNLIWTNYEGFNFGSYRIYRGTDSLNMTLLTQIQSSLTSYTDLNPPSGNVYYQIEVVSPHPCYPDSIFAKANTNYNTSRSNTSNTAAAINISVNNLINIDISLELYPNPNNGNFTLVIDDNINNKLLLNIYNILGEVVYNETIDGIGKLSKELKLNYLSSGVYFVHLITIDNTIYKRKIIINK